MLPGQNAGAVLDLIVRRKSTREFTDRRRLALVVEGGGMRGVYTAGTLLALHLMGVHDSFDDLFGTSAGAVNGAHFLSGVGHTKVSTYYQWLDHFKFINPLRINKVIDIDYFVDEVLTRHARVEIESVAKARTELWIAVLNEHTATVELRNPRRENIPLLDALKAAVALPVLYGKTVRLGGASFMDAGFAQPFALSTAIALGCTDLLVVAARPASDRAKPSAWWKAQLFNRRCAKGNERLISLYRSSWLAQNEERCLADGSTAVEPSVNIATLAPNAMRVKQTTTEPKILRAELIEMCRYVLDVFQYPHEKLELLIESRVI